MMQARFLASTLSPIVLGFLVLWVTAVDIFDYDVWWHIKAGQVMRETGSLIHTDPFAFTREGLPYLATHEWLSQIVLSLAWDLGGPIGIGILRTFLVLCTLGFVLLMNRRFTLFGVMLGVGVLGLLLSGIVDRPQLFSFPIFTAELLLLWRALERGSFTWRTGGAFALLQILWVNVHGAACVLGMALFGAYAVQRIFDAWQAHGSAWPAVLRREARTVFLSGLGLLAAFFISPSGTENLTYLKDLLTDRTAGFISEWLPRAFGPYISDFWWLWIAAIASLISGKRSPVFWGMLLLFLGVLSRQALRHETFLALALYAAVLTNLPGSPLWERGMDWMRARRWRIALPVIVTAAFFWATVSENAEFIQSYSRRGYGAVEQGKGAFAFLERHNIEGPVFNSYELGGYFLFRGYPDRKVFMDGRNVDYGYDFLSKALEAGRVQTAWDVLEATYDFSAAAVLYEPFTDQSPYPFSRFLNGDSAWALAYLDDWTGVYVRRDRPMPPGVKPYTILTPEVLMSQTAFQGRTEQEFLTMEAELQRVIAETDADLQARLQLARLYLVAGITDEARVQIRGAISAFPWRYEPYELLGILELGLKRYEAASDAFAESLRRVGSLADTVDHASLADVASKAGKPLRALLERVRAML